jgi:hypothetical protein
MPAATYIAALVRVHFRALAPLRSEEVAALKRSVAELSAIGHQALGMKYPTELYVSSSRSVKGD